MEDRNNGNAMNEKVTQRAELADLPLTDEQARQAKGGQIDSSDSEYRYVPVRRSY